MAINKGLESVGNTWFGTIYWAGYALLNCLPTINKLVCLNIVKTDGDKERSMLAFLKSLNAQTEFQKELHQLVVILEPIARAIKCLEGLQVTVGDVWKFYVAITAVMRDTFAENSSDIPLSVQHDVRKIVNARYEQMISGPSGPIYLAGFFLDPVYIKSDILQKKQVNQLHPDPAFTTSSALQSTNHTDQDLLDSMPAYIEVGTRLFKMIVDEIKAGRKAPQFDDYKTGQDILQAFKSQFERYTRQQSPFSARSAAWTKPLLYWKAMLQDKEASILAFIAVKIFSMQPTSMAEEWTVSTISRIVDSNQPFQQTANL
ncbi:hypothetical protein C8J56DRAFT_893377 [Mycena floridula]|nr:hypothetical protein C8J56DRAFT_893377 [Mycena floridula]